MAARFDIGRLAATDLRPSSTSVPVKRFGGLRSTDAGLLAYRSGSPGPSTLVWVIGRCRSRHSPGALRGFAHPRVSPEGGGLSRLARTICGSTTWLETRFRSSRFKVAHPAVDTGRT